MLIHAYMYIYRVSIVHHHPDRNPPLLVQTHHQGSLILEEMEVCDPGVRVQKKSYASGSCGPVLSINISCVPAYSNQVCQLYRALESLRTL